MAAWAVEVRPSIEYVVCTKHQLGGHDDGDGLDGDTMMAVVMLMVMLMLVLMEMDNVIFISILFILKNLILIDQRHTTFLISNPIMLLA